MSRSSIAAPDVAGNALSSEVRSYRGRFHGGGRIKDVPGNVHRNVGGIVNPIVNAIVKIPDRNLEKRANRNANRNVHRNG
ncbi:hypothetical protein [Actinospongicola halichondriae]|uniref:hypothetical protein n=1 Tax=Actinospongicola halichondriae TaxID=3236844 RepID=UPI003D43195D